jgi:hypothetical protein
MPKNLYRSLDGERLTKWGLPEKYTACPSCGRQYGHHRTTVCMNCEECSACCRCSKTERKLKPTFEAVTEILRER